MMQQGRLIKTNPASGTLALQNESGVLEASFTDLGEACPGDVISLENGHVRVLTPNRSHSTYWAQQILHPRKLKALKIRSQVEGGIRDFFLGEGFWETRTPLLVPSPGMEPHIRPFSTQGLARDTKNRWFLPTSPEFAMKRLLVGGLERIFQLTPAFRDEPESRTHSPEFLMLEWYRAYSGYEAIMSDVEELFARIARKLFGKPVIPFQGKAIDVTPPWPRLKVRDLFSAHAGVDLVRNPGREDLARECARLGLRDSVGETWDDLYFKIWLNVIEPRLPEDRAVFVTRYPASQAALSVIDEDPDGSRWARRFEVYAGGLELGNAFEELTDPSEQRARFEKDMKLRRETYGADFPPSPIDEGFLEALGEGMPPSGGIAVGVDRMVMLFADEADIGYTVWMGTGCACCPLPDRSCAR